MIFAWLVSYAFAAEAPPAAMETFARKLSVAVGFATNDYALDVEKDLKVEYQPNMSSLTTFSVNYAGVGGFTYGTRGSLGADSQNRGSTTYDDFRLNVPFRQLAVALYYSRYSGFYVSNSDEVDAKRPSSLPNLLYPKMYAQNMGASVTWVANPESYSLAAAQDMSERQTVPGGSVVTGGSVTETFFRNDGPMIAPAAQSGFGRDGRMNDGRLRSFSLKAGYGYTYVYQRRYFASILGTAGFGTQEVRIGTPTDSYGKNQLNLTFTEVVAAAGFNGDTAFTGFTIFALNNAFTAEVAHLSTRLMTASVFVGLRL